MIISVFTSFYAYVISENRAAAFREVNREARGAAALSFYLLVSPNISLNSNIRLIAPFSNHSISM